MQNKHIWIIVAVQVVSALMLMVGIIILAVSTTDKCASGCYESSCRGSDYRIYPCDCGSYCQVKLTVVDGIYRFGISALIIGIVGSIFGCVLLCIYRRRQYYNQQQQTVAVITTAQVPVYGVQQNPYPYAQPVYGQPIPQQQNIPYGIPVTGQPYPTQYQYGQNLQTTPPNYQ